MTWQPGPRADFECATCQAVIQDLPVESVRCPLCGRKRGFRRLYNQVYVSTRRERVRKVDHAAEPYLLSAQAQDEAGRAWERQTQQTLEAQWAELPTEAREVAARHGWTPARRAVEWMSTDQVFGSISPEARQWSSTVNSSVLQRLRLVPIYRH